MYTAVLHFYPNTAVHDTYLHVLGSYKVLWKCISTLRSKYVAFYTIILHLNPNTNIHDKERFWNHLLGSCMVLMKMY